MTAALTGQGKDYIEVIACCHQAIESFAPSVHDKAQVFSKSMTMSKIDSDSDSYCCSDPLWNPNCMTTSDWVRVQPKDPVIHDLIQWYGTRELHKCKDRDSPEMMQFLWQRSKLIMRNGILYCKNDTKESDCPNWNTMQLVLPTTLRLQALKGYHDDLGHLGIERTLDLLRDQFYWPGLTEDMTRHIQHCERCLQFIASPDRAPMENVDATYPMELVHMDYLIIKATEGGKDINILVITDHFTRYAQAIVTSLQTAKCKAQNLWYQFIVHYGLPEKMLTDQGCNFESELLKALCEIAQVKKIKNIGISSSELWSMQMFQCDPDQHVGYYAQKPQEYLEGTGPYLSTCL